MTLETADDACQRTRIENRNYSDADFVSEGTLNGTLIDQQKMELNNNDTKLRRNRESNAKSSLRVVYFSMMTTMTGICY